MKNIEDFYPLSPMQQGMLFHSLYDPDSGVYVGQLACVLHGALDVVAFERAWQRVIERHAILRTAFVSANVKEPIQVVQRQAQLPLAQHDWRELSADQQVVQLETFLAAEQQRGFDLAKAPLMRFALMRLAAERYQFVWTYHHILFDGWSLPLILHEVFTLYTAYAAATPDESALGLPPARPFRSYISWLKKQDLAEAEAFWRRTLAGFTAPTPIRVDRKSHHAAEADPAYVELSAFVAPAPTAALNTLARTQRLTLNTLVQGAWALLLSRYSGETDIVFGATVSGRPANLPGAEQMIGLFINTLPVRVQVPPDARVSDWLAQLQAQQLDLRQYEYSPLVQIHGWSDVPRTSPLFESILVFENTPVAAAVDGAQTHLRVRDVRSIQQTNYPLTVIGEPGAQLNLRISYETARFERATIERMLGHLQTLLEQFAADPQQRLDRLTLLTAAERQQILIDWNTTAKAFPHDRCVHELFEDQVARTPAAIAVRFEGAALTYAELNARSNQLAHYLRTHNVGPETLVGLCAEPSLHLVIGLLGVLKAGGAYLPLEPSYPADRLQFMLEDAQVPVLLTATMDNRRQTTAAGQPTSAILSSMITGPAAVIDLVQDWPQIARQPETNPAPLATPDNLAYVIYTSGSTGRPKGTLLQHRGLCNFAYVAIDWFAITPESRVLQFAAFSFDASVSEIVMALLGGATLVLAARATLTDVPLLLDLLRAEQISTVTLPPSLLHVLPSDDLPHLQTVVSAGEPCAWEIAERWGAGRRFLNGYGPTEATVAAAYYRYTGRVFQASTVPIGGPIANARVYVLDQQGQPVPVGVPGELHIGGAGLARGYLQRPDLTAAKFVHNPFADAGRQNDAPSTPAHGPWSERLYKTGDVVRWLPNGTLEFLGRIDDQVKLRGFRIELGEIEAVLGGHPALAGVAVIAREDQIGDKRIVAYVVARPGEQINASELRDFVQTRLPAYMLPTTFVTLDEFPLTPNGKINRKALPAPASTHDAASFVAPRTPEEEILAGLWEQVLGVAQVSAYDNFFELGGHSLLATQLVSRLREAFGVDLPLRTIFEAPTLADLAQQLKLAKLAAQGVHVPPLERITRDQPLPLSFAQQRLWFLDQLEPGSPLYNIPTAARLNGPLDVTALERSFNTIIARHEILRTTIVTEDGQPRQIIAAQSALTLRLEDLSALPASEREVEARRIATAEAQQPFDLGQGPLLRARLLKLADTEHVALITLHHIVSDGWSMNVLIREIAALYEAYATEQAPVLPDLPIQYADYAAWQRQWLQGDVLAEQLAYWKRQLAGALPLLELPTDRPRPAVQSYRGASHTFTFAPQLGAQLKALSQKQGATLFMTLLAAWQTLLHRYSGQTDISVGTPIANRTRGETEALIGFFANTLVLRSDFSDAPTFRALLKQVRETALGAYAHQDVPFEMIVDALQPARNLSYPPLFQVLFALQNAPQHAQQVSALLISPEDAHSGTAKFDLTLELIDAPDGLGGSLEYTTDLFDPATIARMIDHYETLLTGIVTDPDLVVTRLPLLSSTERAQLLQPPTAWQPAVAAFAQERCLHELFEQQAARTPDALAVSYENQHLTYAELNARANQLAHYLRAHNVGPETLVGLCLDRSLHLVIGILGILKAGGAYLPLDLAYPPERLQFMLQDARVPVLLTATPDDGRQTTAAGRPTSAILSSMIHGSWSTVDLVRDWPQIAREADANLSSGATPDNLAYVIYTSGSTGQPKGCMITHANVVRLFTATDEWYGFNAQDVWTLFHSYAFDFSVWELWGALLYGGRLVVVPYVVSRSPEAFYDLLATEQVTVLNQTPSAFRQLIRAEEAVTQRNLALRYVIFGGEALEFQSLQPWFARHGDQQPQLVNMYGITETTVHVTYRPVSLADLQAHAGSAIGVPIPDLHLYILDQYGQPVPLGVAGELYVGGAGVARGYLNRPELTEARFVPNPFAHDERRATDVVRSTPAHGPWSDRLYKTGDMARRLPNGDIEYLGRIDDQVKIRGFRIELGEIEAVLAQQPQVREAFVTVREDTPGDKRIAAYVVPAQDVAPSVADLRSALKHKLPEYMLPSAFVVLEALPLTPNGKIDRKALPLPDGARPDLGASYVAPRTAAEQTLATIWQQVLGVKQVGVEDNFFELGGDSILSIQVIARAKQAGLHLTPRQFFQQPTVAGLAAVAGTAGATEAEQDVVLGAAPLLPIQRWFFEHHPFAPDHWNTSLFLETPPLNTALLDQVVRALLQQHDALRLRFVRADNGWRQYYAPPEDASPLSIVDLTAVAADAEQAAIEAAAAQFQTTLNLAAGPIMRVVYINLGAQRPARVLIIFHHLAVDGVSIRIFAADMQRAYQQLVNNAALQLPAKTTSYQSWGRRLEAYAQTAALRQELDYWLQIGQQRVTRVPVDLPNGANSYGETDIVNRSLNAAETQALLQDVAAAFGTQINAVLLTALARTLADWIGQPNVLIELEGHGREDLFADVDLSRTIGWFTTMFPMLLDLGATTTPVAALHTIQRQLAALPQNGIGYGLLRYLCADPNVAAQMAALPQPEVNFNYLGQFDHGGNGSNEAALFHVAREQPGPGQHPQSRRWALLFVVASVTGGELDVYWSYSPSVHRRATIERLAQRFMAELRALIAQASTLDLHMDVSPAPGASVVVEGERYGG